MDQKNWLEINKHILELEQEGLVTRTFRRLDPERQETIIEAILDEAIEKGPTAINIKEIARRANVSVGSLYQYFTSRDGLLDFTIELAVRFINDSFNEFRPLLAALPLKDALLYYLVGGIEWSKMQTGLIQFFAKAAYQGDKALEERVVRPIAETMLTMVSEILTQAAERGEVRDDIDIEAVKRIINVLMIAVGDSQILPYLNTYFQVTGKEVSFEKVVEAIIKIVTEGIGVKEEG